MIDHQAIVTRIRSLSLFRIVGGAAEASVALDGKISLGDGPNAYVVPLGDQASPPVGREVEQEMIVTFGVAYMVRAAGDASGFSGMAQITELQTALRQGLLGWSPAGDFDPIWSDGGSLLDFRPGLLWWLDRFHSRTAIFGDL